MKERNIDEYLMEIGREPLLTVVLAQKVCERRQ